MACCLQLAESSKAEPESEAAAVFSSSTPSRPAKKQPTQALAGFDEGEEEEEEEESEEDAADNDV